MTPIISILILALSVAMAVLYVKPARPRIEALKQDIQFLDDTLERARELQSVRDKLLAKYNSFTPRDIERLQKLLPDNVDNVRLIIDIDEMARRYGLAIQDIEVKQPRKQTAQVTTEPDAEADDFSTGARAAREEAEAQEGLIEPTTSSLTLSFSIVAPYERFLAFLGDLERSLRIVDVKELAFESGKEETDRAYLFKIKVETYWLQ
jgi:Tfp pilus assembly protein PilO